MWEILGFVAPIWVAGFIPAVVTWLIIKRFSKSLNSQMNGNNLWLSTIFWLVLVVSFFSLPKLENDNETTMFIFKISAISCLISIIMYISSFKKGIKNAPSEL